MSHRAVEGCVVDGVHESTSMAMGAEVGGLTPLSSAPTAPRLRGGSPQLIEVPDGETAVRLRTVRNAAPPRASSAIAAPAPTPALAQSNPSAGSAGEPETTVGSLAGAPLIAFSEE
jgi:hypothetical protein